MGLSRKSFIRWVLAGGAAAACPWKGSAEEKAGAASSPSLGSESNALCHRVRDGDSLPMPAPSRRCAVAVVGGGPSGLAAADRLQDEDFLLLEKEGHVGGNCYTESWQGLNYSTGAAWASIFSPEVGALFKRWKFDLKPIRGLDSVFVDGTWVPEFWSGKAGHPSHARLGPAAARDVDAFCRELEEIDLDRDEAKLDLVPFSRFLEKRHPVLTRFWDRFGMSNWGAPSALTAASVGLDAAKNWSRDQRYSFEGGLGVGARRIYESIAPARRSRVLLGAAVYQVERRGEKAVVRYMQGGQAHALEASRVVMAAPKIIAKHLVSGIPDGQRKAMGQIRYAPYLVLNLCFERVVYNQAYDNWVLGAEHFTDFIPADWVVHADGGDLSRRQVLTVYCPKPESARAELVDDAKALAMAQAAAEELLGLFPSWAPHLSEARVYRRGHPMFMSTPGLHTSVQPEASKDLPPVFFAHADSGASFSDLAYAGMLGVQAAERALADLAAPAR